MSAEAIFGVKMRKNEVRFPVMRENSSDILFNAYSRCSKQNGRFECSSEY
jgi:hypothetical protein